MPDPLPRLRRICLALPQATERRSHGEPAWFIEDKRLFAMYADRHHDARVACWCAAPAGAQDVLVRAAPERYFVPPYVGHRGWIGVYLDVPVDWDEVAAIVEDAWRAAAPKRLLAARPAAPLSSAGSARSRRARTSRDAAPAAPARGARSSAGASRAKRARPRGSA
jgi:hypothetical protein